MESLSKRRVPPPPSLKKRVVPPPPPLKKRRVPPPPPKAKALPPPPPKVVEVLKPINVERKEPIDEPIDMDSLTIFDGGPHRPGYGDDDLPF